MITEARQSGARLKQACKVIGITDRTYQRWFVENNIKEDQRPFAGRPKPANKLTKEEYNSVLKVANLPQYADLPPSQIVPALADKGMYIASESTMYRILKNENMQHHRGRSKKPAPRSKPDTYIASDSNQVWTWDITYLNTFVRGLYYKLYMILDIFSRKIVGWEVWPEESGEYAAVLVERAFVDEKIGNAPLVLHSDNGSPMKALTLKTKLESLGIISSYSRPRVSNDNPYSEALFRTCKYCSEYPTEGFESVDSAREWVNGFVEWYNNKHYHSGLNFVTPNTRHNGTAIEIMKKREIVYNTAKKLHPERWTGNTRNWELPETVALNPTREITSHVKNTS